MCYERCVRKAKRTGKMERFTLKTPMNRNVVWTGFLKMRRSLAKGEGHSSRGDNMNGSCESRSALAPQLLGMPARSRGPASFCGLAVCLACPIPAIHLSDRITVWRKITSMSLISFAPSMMLWNRPDWERLSSFYSWGNWGPERLARN